MLRFGHVLERLGGSDRVEWGELAQLARYYDQAHFNREFRAFSGATPSDYLRRRLPDGSLIAG